VRAGLADSAQRPPRHRGHGRRPPRGLSERTSDARGDHRQRQDRRDRRAAATRGGDEVAIANSRGPESLRELVAELGENTHAATIEDAAGLGEIVLVAIPLRAYTDLPPSPFAGKIVIDANNYYSERDGHIEELDRGFTTSSELLAAHLSGSRVVKAFNTMHYRSLAAEARPDAPRAERLALYVAADDDDARRRAGELIERLGFAAVDTGSLSEGGVRQQPGSPLYNARLTAVEAQQRVAAVRQR
jgi:predicted dinucleotide-binding enzyme